MATTPVSLQQPGCVSSAKHDSGIVLQAAAYHRMLANPGLDGGYDEFDDVDHSFSDSDSEDMARHPNNSNLAHPGRDNEDHPPRVPVFGIKLHHPLLTPPGPRTLSEERLCINSSYPRPGLWAAEPDLGLSDHKMGFLSQLAQLCIHANVKRCSRDKCEAQRAAMDKIAPQCNWAAFREWALVTMSCQAAMNTLEKESPAHTHITTVVSGLCKILKDCRRLQSPLDSTATPFRPFRPFLDGDSPTMAPIDLAQVSNLIYWMIKIQSQIGVGPTKLGRWNHHFLPNEVTLPWIERAVRDMDDLGLCKNRLWNLVSVSDRKQSDLPDIISALKSSDLTLGQGEHDSCTPSKCQWAHLNSASVTQLHKCGSNGLRCTQTKFPVELLETALEMGTSTAWLCKGAKLSGSQDPYIAISHVWSDGTGVGLKNTGTVNSCLFDFFASIAQQPEIGCKAVWWDALSIPSEPKARSKALNMMHSNYANARHTVVHDNSLLNFPWSDDGSPCLALVLSTWFTRGWTALELSMSKSVKVLFRNPDEGQPPLLKDLDEHILAQGPGSTSRAHWLATTLVRRLRQPVNDVGDLLAILSSRSTSWVRDRTIIAALLAGVPDCDFNQGESLITTKVLHYLGKIPYFCLLHGKPTMRNKGPYSWCAATLDDMPVDTSADLGGNRTGDLLGIDESGAVDGYWYCHTLDSSSVKRLKAYGNDLAVTVKVNIALAHWERCLLLHPSADRHHPLSLLVIPIKGNKEDGILDCRYVGTVEESKPERPTTLLKIRLGAEEHRDAEGMHAKHAIDTMAGKITPAIYNSDEQSQSTDDNSHERSQSTDGQPEVPKWLQFAKPLDEHQSVKPLQPELVIRMDHNELLKAIQARRKNAALYLVKHDELGLGARELVDIFQQLGSLGSIEEACATMKLLGDVYAKAGKLRDAISIYKFVEHEYFKIMDTVKNQLRPLLFKYALATTFGRAAREPGAKEAPYGVSAADYVKAEEFLNQILEECDRRVETRSEADLPAQESRRPAQERRNTLQDSSGFGLLRGVPPTRELSRCQSVPDIEIFSSNSDGQSSAMSQSGKHPTVARAEQARDALRWHRLELNVIADLTLLLTGKEDFDGAAKTFQKAFRTFGSLPDQDVEGFNLQCPERGRLGFEEKNQRDEQAADVYQRALKRFDVTFHGDHFLIFLTSLHLGVNHLLRSKFSSAETNLMRALNGFVSRLSPLSSGNQHSALSCEDCNDEHIIIGLTRYYLGVLFRNQNKLEEAQKELQQAKKIASRFHGYQGQLLLLSATHELGMLFSQKLKSEQKIDHLVSGADECFKEVSQRAENWLKGDEGHQPPRRLAMRRLYFLSFSNSILLHLHHGKLQAEVIEKLKRNLDEYEEAKGDAAELKKEDKKAIDVAKCEARRILGQAYMRRKEFHRAVTELGIALEGYIYLYGERHLQTLDTSMMYVDILLQLPEGEQARRADPEKLLEAAVEIYDQTVGSYHPESLLTCLKLGQVYTSRHKLAEAEKFCERAHHGFENFYGSGHLLTARASRLLGRVYFEKGTLGKAQEMYDKAYKAFLAMSNEPGPAAVTDIETLQAAMDYANVCALIRTTVTRNTAMDLYRLAIEGFSSWDNSLAVTSKLVACMRLGALYGEICHFPEGRVFIEAALSGFQGLLDENSKVTPDDQFRSTQDSVKESLLEAQLKLAQLKLNEHKREENHTGDIKAVRLTIQDTHNKLVKLLGEIHMLTLEAYTALGELYLEGHGGSKPEHSPAKGEQILVEVLKHHETNGKAKLALGHPKKVRIMDSLISYYDRIGEKSKVHDLNSQLWDELVGAYGFDQAVLIIDATSGPKHTARCINFDQGRFKKSWKSGACSETSSFGTGLTAIAKFFGHGRIDSNRTGVSKRKRPESVPYQQPSSPKAGSFARRNSLDYNRNSFDKGVHERNDTMSGALPQASSSTLAGTLDRSNNSKRHGVVFERDLLSSGALPQASSSTLAGTLDRSNNSQRHSVAFERDLWSSGALPQASSSTLGNNPQRHSVAFERDLWSSGALPQASSSTLGGTLDRSNNPESAVFGRDPRKSGALPGASLSNPSLNIADCLAAERSALKRPLTEPRAYPEASSSAASSSARADDTDYNGSQKRRKLFGKLKEAGGKLKEAGREIKEAGKILGSSRHKGT